MSKRTRFNAEQICYGAVQRMRRFLDPGESCDLSKDESKAYFVFRFTIRDAEGVREIARLSVLGAMIEDGVISENSLHAHLWQELGRIRGMA
jgi:hypothetical protein